MKEKYSKRKEISIEVVIKIKRLLLTGKEVTRKRVSLPEIAHS